VRTTDFCYTFHSVRIVIKVDWAGKSFNNCLDVQLNGAGIKELDFGLDMRVSLHSRLNGWDGG
jgi:hypothetical protein